MGLRLKRAGLFLWFTCDDEYGEEEKECVEVEIPLTRPPVHGLLGAIPKKHLTFQSKQSRQTHKQTGAYTKQSHTRQSKNHETNQKKNSPLLLMLFEQRKLSLTDFKNNYHLGLFFGLFCAGLFFVQFKNVLTVLYWVVVLTIENGENFVFGCALVFSFFSFCFPRKIRYHKLSS